MGEQGRLWAKNAGGLAHSSYLIVGPRRPTMLSTEAVQGLEANVQLTRARKLGKIRYHKVWLRQ